MTPEALASVEIDRLITAAGWHVCDFRQDCTATAAGPAILMKSLAFWA